MANPNDSGLTFTRIFNAPPGLVFQAFAQAEQVRQWWGPNGWAMPVCTIDFRPGGEWLYCIRNAQGEEHWARAIYHEITPVEQIVFSDVMIDAQGRAIPGLPSKRTTVILEDLGGKTQCTVHVQLETTADRQKLIELGFIRGFSEALNNLEQQLNQLVQSLDK